MPAPKLGPMARRLTFEYYNNNLIDSERPKKVFARFLLLNRTNLGIGRRFVYGVMLRGNNCLFLKSDFFEPQQLKCRICPWPPTNHMSEKGVLTIYKLIKVKDQFLYTEFGLTTEGVAWDVVKEIEGTLKLKFSIRHQDSSLFVQHVHKRLIELHCPIGILTSRCVDTMDLDYYSPEENSGYIPTSLDMTHTIRGIDFSHLSSTFLDCYKAKITTVQSVTVSFYINTGFERFTSILKKFMNELFKEAYELNIHLTMPWRGVENFAELQKSLVETIQKIEEMKKNAIGDKPQQWNCYSNILHYDKEACSELQEKLPQHAQFQDFQFKKLQLFRSRSKRFQMLRNKNGLLFNFKFTWQDF